MDNKKTFGIEVTLISALLAFLGLGGLFLLIQTAYNAPEVQFALENNTSLILPLLDSVGIIVPALTLFLGISFLRLAIKASQQHIGALRWAQVALFWVMVGTTAFALLQFFTESQPNPILGTQGDLLTGLIAAMPWVLIAVPCGLSQVWFGRNRETLMRDETLQSRNVRMAWNLLMPTLAILIVVAARPLEKTFIISLTDKRFAGTEEINFIGLDNYSSLLSMRLDTVNCRTDDAGNCRFNRDGSVNWENIPTEYLQAGFRPVTTIAINATQAIRLSSTDSSFIQSAINTVHFTVASVSLELILGLFIALVVNSNFMGRGVMRAVMLVPWAIPTVISARLWEMMLRDNQSGIINKILIDLGLQETSQAWLSNANLQINTLIMVDVWKTTPFMALLLLAGLQLIPKDLYEASAIDGANKVQQFFRVTLPLLRPTIAIALVFRSLDALRVFDVFQVLLKREKLSMATYNYEVLIQTQRGGYASAVSVLIFILILIFTVIYVRAVKVETS